MPGFRIVPLFVLTALTGCPHCDCSGGFTDPSVEAVTDPVKSSVIRLTGVGELSVPAGAFNNKNRVVLSATHSKETSEAFEATAPGEVKRASREIRINTDRSLPVNALDLEILIPTELQDSLKDKSEALVVFAEIFYDGGNETLDSFQSVPYKLEQNNSVRLVLTPQMFTSMRNASQTYEAVVLLGVGSKNLSLTSP